MSLLFFPLLLSHSLSLSFSPSLALCWYLGLICDCFWFKHKINSKEVSRGQWPEPEQSRLLIIMQATWLPYWDICNLDITSVLCTVWELITIFEKWKRSGSYCSIENQNTFIHMIQTLFSAQEMCVGVMLLIPRRSKRQRYECSMLVFRSRMKFYLFIWRQCSK